MHIPVLETLNRITNTVLQRSNYTYVLTTKFNDIIHDILTIEKNRNQMSKAFGREQ